MGGTVLGAQVRSGNREVEENAFQWGGELAAGRKITLRSINGRIEVEPASGRTVEVVATKRWRRGGDASHVRIEATRTSGGDVLVCARWTPETVCNETSYSVNLRNDRNEVSVDFSIRLPAGAHASLNVTNGEIEVTGASGNIEARTTNGSITAESTAGTVEASTTNGSLEIRMAKLPERGASYRTTNGAITLVLPEGLDADFSARTTNGHVQSDFEITMSGTLSRQMLQGRIGRGGPRLEASTTNGMIRLERSR
jgi:hypothetical protein